MKQPSSSFDGGKPSTRSESVHMIRQPFSPRRQLSNRNTNQSSVCQASRKQNVPDEVPGLTDLIWKHFEREIREALMEAQESIAITTTNVQSS